MGSSSRQSLWGAVASTIARPGVRLLGWLSSRHSLLVELVLVLGLYAVYEATRGLVVGGRGSAVRHAGDVVALERSLHIFVERNVQDATEQVPDLIGTLGIAYLMLHLAVTGCLLLWLHRARPQAYPFVRTTLLLASALALVGYSLYPTAPPRLAGVDILDTISGHAHVDLNKGLVSALYNPYAAIPSMHAGYALIVGGALARNARHQLSRLAGAIYPAVVMVVIVATGNHFLLDAASGALVALVAAAATSVLLRPVAAERVSSLPKRRCEGPRERLAA